MWDTKHAVGATPPKHENPPAFGANVKRPVISKSLIGQWVPRGYIVVHSSSPGTGLSQGCPTVGGDNESLAPKAVIDWLCGRAKGYKEVDGDETVEAFWSSGKVGMTGTSYNGTLPLAAATTGCRRPGGHHSSRSEHFLLPLLSVEWLGTSPWRLHG